MDPLSKGQVKAAARGKPGHFSRRNLNIATEASRQWKVERQGIKDYYQTLADEAARLHKMKYPNYRYKPGRK